MADAFATCLAFTLTQEGGFVDDPYDPGGATNKGITLATWRAYRGDWSLTPEQLRAISDSEVADIYVRNYWQPSHAWCLAPGLALMVFDEAVNAGPSRSIKLLQKAAKTDQDGLFGPATWKASGFVTPDALGQAQYWFYRSLPTFAHFGRGWTNRIKARETAAAALDMPPAPVVSSTGNAG